MSDGMKSIECKRCGVSADIHGPYHHVLDIYNEFYKRHRHEIVAWVCWSHDMANRVEAIFDNEVDALRYAVGSGYLKVAPVEAGELKLGAA